MTRVSGGPLSRTEIVAAALGLLDEVGIDRLTVRALAARLEVKAPALYWHFADKQELLDEMGTEIQRRVVTRVAGLSVQHWPEPLREYARILRTEYLRHRDGARSFSGTRLTDPAVLQAQEPWFVALAEDGVEVERVVEGADLVTSFVVGFVIEEQERTQSATQPGAERYSLAARNDLVGAGFPLVARAGVALFADPDTRFERNLAVLIAGLALQ